MVGAPAAAGRDGCDYATMTTTATEGGAGVGDGINNVDGANQDIGGDRDGGFDSPKLGFGDTTHDEDDAPPPTACATTTTNPDDGPRRQRQQW